jgi:hypothetical protein
MEGSHKFTLDLESAVNVFYPVLKRLQIKRDIKDNIPISVALSCFDQLKEIDSISKWEIVILKRNLINTDNTALFMLKLEDPQFKDSKIKCFIVIDERYYPRGESFRVVHETRLIIAVHEFMHFLSYVFARINNHPSEFLEISKVQLSKKIDLLSTKTSLELYNLFNGITPVDDLTNSKNANDEHFRLRKDDTPLNYTELYKNLMLPFQLFDEYFSEQDKERFSKLWREQKYGEADDLYKDIAKRVAREEWITEKFAIHQAYNFLNKYYAYSILNNPERRI